MAENVPASDAEVRKMREQLEYIHDICVQWLGEMERRTMAFPGYKLRAICKKIGLDISKAFPDKVQKPNPPV